MTEKQIMSILKRGLKVFTKQAYYLTPLEMNKFEEGAFVEAFMGKKVPQEDILFNLKEIEFDFFEETIFNRDEHAENLEEFLNGKKVVNISFENNNIKYSKVSLKSIGCDVDGKFYVLTYDYKNYNAVSNIRHLEQVLKNSKDIFFKNQEKKALAFLFENVKKISSFYKDYKFKHDLSDLYIAIDTSDVSNLKIFTLSEETAYFESKEEAEEVAGKNLKEFKVVNILKNQEELL